MASPTLTAALHWVGAGAFCAAWWVLRREAARGNPAADLILPWWPAYVAFAALSALARTVAALGS